MPILITALLSTQIITLSLGLVVYFTNTKRLINKQFLILSIHLTLWALCVLRIIESSDSASADYWIRAAFVVTAFFPASFTLLLSSIKYSTASWPSLYARHTPFLLLNLIAAILPLTPFFLHGVIIPEQQIAGAYSVAEATYGFGYYVYITYFIGTCIAAGLNFYRVFRESIGIQRYELQFILYGFGASFLVGVFSAFLLPLFFNGIQTSQFGPLGIVLLDAIVAYGITTRKILGIAIILQRITAYALLVLYLVLLYFITLTLSQYLLSNFISASSSLPHLFAAMAAATSMIPVHGRFQMVANKLILSNTMDVSATMKRASSIFQSVTTIDALLNHFADLLTQALPADVVTISLKNHDTLDQHYPMKAPENQRELKLNDPICLLAEKTAEPISAVSLARSRPTKLTKTAERQLTDLGYSVAIGIFSKTGLSGLVFLGKKMGGRVYNKTEQDALQILCNQFAVALENAQMYTEMQDSKIRNEIMLDQLVSGVIVADPERKVTLINNEAQRIIKLTEEQAIGQDIAMLPKTITRALEATLSSQSSVRNVDAILFPQEETSTHVRMGSAYLLGHDNNPMGALLVFTDMTEMKSLEEQVRRSDQLSSVGTLAAGMAHEIKNPLVTIKTFTQLLPERHDDVDFRKDFSALVAHEVARIDGIVNQLLSFSKPSQPLLVPMKLHDTVEKTLKLIQEQLVQKNIDLKKDFRAQQDLISGDADLLTQTLVNLNLNAIDAIESDGSIRVTTTNCTYRFANGDDPESASSRSCIRLQISDTGKGIEADQLQKIFDPFFTSKSEGTGMGLSVAHGIIQEHHGVIEVQSEPEKGTTFNIYIPLLKEDTIA